MRNNLGVSLDEIGVVNPGSSMEFNGLIDGKYRAIILVNDEDDWELWITEDPEDYTEGCSVRGTREQIRLEVLDSIGTLENWILLG